MLTWSYPYATPDTRGPAMGATGDASAVLDALAAAGYRGVELLVRDPRAVDVPAVRAALAGSGLVVAAIGTGPVVADDRLTLADADGTVRRRAVDRARSAVDLAAELGGHVAIGKLRGSLGDDPDRAWDHLRAGLSVVAGHAGSAGVVVVLEPQGPATMDNLTTTEEGLGFVRDLALPSVALMLDLLHVEAADPAPVRSWAAAGEHLRYVHVADSGRAAPGRGGFDLPAHLAALEATGYDGFATVEIAQGADPLVTAREAIRYVSGLTGAPG
ncbi:sugar phosphate isomerase/epimerase family protein [Kineococcus sp. SYSU DK001]|uniref:sugar phosphate isomerase/epimerase family protein n=1 Tax=Kineococcus sp. SYSU DK001 TaxID=3383122 RepID=UPI003D7D517C